MVMVKSIYGNEVKVDGDLDSVILSVKECPLCGMAGYSDCHQETDLGICGGLHPSSADHVKEVQEIMRRWGYGK